MEFKGLELGGLEPAGLELRGLELRGLEFRGASLGCNVLSDPTDVYICTKHREYHISTPNPKP